ncbi:unnamed protein product [Somion occarium]|uniref:Uncharacterized protein n=1 Tax=Somion occarium TaxID=3059160 RepID=A0ABP1E6W4_9APHY
MGKKMSVRIAIAIWMKSKKTVPIMAGCIAQSLGAPLIPAFLSVLEFAADSGPTQTSLTILNGASAFIPFEIACGQSPPPPQDTIQGEKKILARYEGG